jgi:pilus assembly protein CpaF
VEHPTLSATTAGDWLANTFDLVVEVARLADGRPRIVRIAELSSQSGMLEARDVFVYSPSDPTAGPEGHFHPTGPVPSVVEELLDREGGLDRSIFDRVSR